MAEMTHRYLTVAYKLYVTNNAGVQEIIEEAPTDHPFQFITNLGGALETFEQKVATLNAGDKFDFTLSQDEAYGAYDDERVVEVSKEAFMIDGRFDDKVIFPGNYIPLVNEEGQRFEGLVADVLENTVKIDLNSPLAGMDLHYVGEVVTARPATNEEVQGFINMLTGGGCGCGCHDGEDAADSCGCGGHGHHHHSDNGECACGGHEHHHHDELGKWAAEDADENEGTECACGGRH